MQLVLGSLLAAGLMPFLFTGIAKLTGTRFNNRNPRTWQAGLEGMPLRAHAAHLNCFEAFPLFAAAVLYALHVGAPADRLGLLALAFVGLRLLFGLLYLANQATLRSLVWALALGVNVAIFFQGP